VHSTSAKLARFDATGNQLVTVSDDGMARVWDTTTTAPLTRLLQHEGRVTSAEFNSGGTLVLTVTDRNQAYVWSAVTGELAAPPLLPGRKITKAAFTKDGTRIVLVGETGGSQDLKQWVELYELPSDSRSLQELRNLAHLTAGRKVDELSDSVVIQRPDLEKLWRSRPGEVSGSY
jgi:WD40 repeat protein